MSIRGYSEYVASDVMWFGKLPSHWKSLPFKWLVARNDGGVWGDDPDGLADTVVLRSTEQSVDGRWKIDDPAMRKLSSSEKRAALLEVDDLLVTKSSGSALHIGKTTLTTPEVAALDCCYSNFMQRIRVRASMLPKLAWYIMNSEMARLQFDLLSNSTTGLANLNGAMIGQLQVPVAPLHEQAAIVTFLDRETAKIDALIAEQEKLLVLLDEKRQATISRAVTRGLSRDVPIKNSEGDWFGGVPQHWRVSPIKYLARVGNGSTPNRDNPGYWTTEGFPWLNSSVVNLNEVASSDQFVTEMALDECHLPIIEPPAVLVGITGQGKTRGMATQLLFRATVNQHLAYLKPEERTLTVPFLLRVLEMAYQHLRTESDGAGSTKGAITCEQLGRLIIPLPDIAEQNAIASFLDSEMGKLDTLGLEATSAITLLKERRTALITAAVTGKIDVRNAVSDELAA